MIYNPFDEAQMRADYYAVSEALGVQDGESLSGAAFRVLRLPRAQVPQVTLDIARLVVRTSMQPAEKQWKTLRDAAERIRSQPKG